MSAVKNPSIGTLKESSLHKSLKLYYSGEDGQIEYTTDSFVCDAITGYGEIIEVQTGSFAPLKEKAKLLCKNNRLKIVHPVICAKNIEVYTGKNKLIRRRKSRIKGCKWDLFNALVYAPMLPKIKNLSIELILIDITEKRMDDGKGSWRRKGISIKDRFLDNIHGSLILKKPGDYLDFIPFTKEDEFTAKEMAEKAKINMALARKTLYSLNKMGVLEYSGKRSAAYLYRIKTKPPRMHMQSKKKPAPRKGAGIINN